MIDINQLYPYIEIAVGVKFCVRYFSTCCSDE